ncbi:acyl-CoA dehydrogenase family protein [Geochorda subterranea]|uniref:Acyl-CoA dehydrogenase family protein n=1 Tax=Geochorda subterranea TaxID=3109564 RepID=A0ABZ1BR70_9FIRM|nr:acyl-CoA dehydrogenase family protein [Limnochorda sp. LNt]WRP15005.1 acyl-CoA dehydrogenase family protein [Limnochorda sp. LNt]
MTSREGAAMAVAAAGWRLSEEQEAFRRLTRQLAETHIAPRAREYDRTGEFPWDVVQLFREQDLFSLCIPEAYGGAGTDLLTLAVVIEELARVDATASLILAVQELGSLPIILGGDEAQKRRWLPPLATGERLAAFALTEPEAGSDAAAIRTRATRRGDRWVLEGTKRFITNGSVADVVVVFATVDPSLGHRGVTAFVVEKGTPGFSVSRVEEKMGLHASPTAELVFDGCEVPLDHRLGGEGEGFKIAMMTLDRSRPGVAAQALGIAQGALDYAVGYLKERRQFGKALAEFQGLQFMVADMATQVEAARQLLYHACRLIHEHGYGRLPAEINRYAAMAKLFCSDVAMRVTTDAVQLLGGYGYVKEHPVERMMRDAKITQIYEGTNQIQRLVIARSLLG